MKSKNNVTIHPTYGFKLSAGKKFRVLRKAKKAINKQIDVFNEKLRTFTHRRFGIPYTESNYQITAFNTQGNSIEQSQALNRTIKPRKKH